MVAGEAFSRLLERFGQDSLDCCYSILQLCRSCVVQAYLDTGFEVVSLEGFDCKKVANYKPYRATNNWLHFVFHIRFSI